MISDTVVMMKRVKKYRFLSLLWVPLLLGACQQETTTEKVPSKGGTGSTPLRLEAYVRSDSSTRTVEQKDDAGLPSERSVSSMTVLFNDLPSKEFGKNELTTEGAKVMTPVFEMSEEEVSTIQQVSVLLNGSALGLSPNDFNKDKTIRLSDFEKLVDTSEGVGKYKDFLMTATAENKVALKHSIPQQAVQSGGTENNVSLDVERVLSKVQVRLADQLTFTGEVASTQGTLDVDHLTYALAGSAKEAYLFRDYAGATSKMDDATLHYGGKTFVDADTLKAFWKGTQPEHPFLQRVSDYVGKTGAEADNFRARPIPHGEPTAADAIYFLENSTAQEITDRGQLEYNRIAYVKIYGTFTPAKGYEFVPGTGKYDWSFKEVDTFPGGYSEFRLYRQIPNRPYEEQFNVYKAALGDTEDPNDPNDMWVTWDGAENITLHIKDSPGTFYYGEDDGKFYTNLTSAWSGGIHSSNGKNVKIRRYPGGKMVWLNPVNAQIVDNGGQPFVKNANTRRNNIYDLTITGFSGLGLPYDPIDPLDPNIPHRDRDPYPEAESKQLQNSNIKVDPSVTKVYVQVKVYDWEVQELNYTLKSANDE